MILRIPFTRSAYTGNTTPPWEHNDWFRSNGYELPLDTYLMLQWIAGLTVDVGFFGFLYYFINGQPIADTTNELVTAWNPEAEAGEAVTWPWSAWSWKIMVVFSIGVKALSIITSFIPTEEPIVATQRDEVPRSKTYVRKYGIPVVDSVTGICGICRIKVPRSTRHCKLCNKCVAGMDHHCRWLNCCIGQRNYRLFMVLITHTFLALVWYSSVTIFTLWSSIYQKNVFAGQAWELFHPNYALKAESTDASTTVSRTYYFSVISVVILTGLSLVGTVAMLRLLCFHIRLACMNTTTVEYINRMSNYRSLYDDTDDEDDYSDDYYDDFSEPDSEIEDDEWRSAVSSTNKPAASMMPSQYIVQSWRVFRKLGRPWRRLVRRYLPGYNRYQQLHRRRSRQSSTSFFWYALSFILCSDTKRKRPRRHPAATTVRHRDVHMEEILATQTIRPTLTLDEDGPDYNDDMGLDTSILDEKFTPPMNKRLSKNKAARILDITDEEAVRYQQSHQDQRVLLQERKQQEKTDDNIV
ncbi:DHHC palmitoyltransferase-domain-containing protein [Fennellomyces sp. T-0311]|nr:DHHC palmitoyltransferase-domain-containing protein [Fennellomyces sp. T-0311]